ncbi:MAG: DUF6261 family protein [Prevotellaceae bacterium]|jgi:hypothetical protein|nr:DUF6261 family protein [Prevotellaceae bacterium]
MRKIVRATLHSYHGEQWFQFFTELKRLLAFYKSLGIDEEVALFLILYDKADIALEIIRKSDKTELIDIAGAKRDIIFRGLSDAVKSLLRHFNEDVKHAAVQLQIVFDHYGNVARLPNDEETASIYNMLQELKGPYAAQINTLRLNEWVEELEKNNTTFQLLVAERNSEESMRSSLRMKEIRKEGDALYRKMVERLEALMLIYGEEPYAAFVDEWNNVVKHYNNIIAARKGRASTKKDSPETENQDTENVD